MLKRLRSLASHRIVQNTAALYGVQLFRKVLPLMTIPYLARTLGPSGWGTMAFVLSFSSLIVMLVEFGFNITATREIARNRGERDACGDIVAGTVGVQIGLFVLGIAGVLAFANRMPLLQGNPGLLFASLFFVTSQCFTPLWFFQGMEWMRSASALEVTGKVLAFGGILLFVHHPSDAGKALALQGIPFLLQTVVGVWAIYREVPFRLPTWVLMRDALVRGWTMFVFRSGLSLYTVANVFILGMIARPEVVGYYSAAERINSALLGLINPITEALFPRLSRLAAASPEKAARLASIGSAFTAGIGLILPLSMYFAAPLMIRVLVGSNFVPAVGVLRVLALLIPFAALTVSVGFQWLLPRGKDHVVTMVILGGGAINIGLALLLAPRFAQVGMAWSAVLSEVFVGIAMVWASLKFTSFGQEDFIVRWISATWARCTNRPARVKVAPFPIESRIAPDLATEMAPAVNSIEPPVTDDLVNTKG